MILWTTVSLIQQSSYDESPRYMGTLERAATLYAASVMLGLLGLGAGLALLGVWLYKSAQLEQKGSD